jgi:hypothetical protein
MVTVNLPDEFTIPLGRKGVYGSRVIRTADYPENILVHWFMYGTRQSTNDAMADKKDDDGIKLSDTDIVAKADKRLATYKLGELRTQRESSEPADPVEREAWRMAREKIEKQLTAELEHVACKGSRQIRPGRCHALRIPRPQNDHRGIYRRVVGEKPESSHAGGKERRSGREIDGRRRRDGVIETDAGARAPVFLWRQ